MITYHKKNPNIFLCRLKQIYPHKIKQNNKIRARHFCISLTVLKPFIIYILLIRSVMNVHFF